MADDAASTSSNSDRSSNRHRRLLGLRQLSDDTRHFFRDNYHKARNLRHRHGGSDSSPQTPSSGSFFPESPTESSPTTPVYTPTKSTGGMLIPSRKSLPRIPQQPTPSLTTNKPRLHHLSALRIGLTSLVIYHHTAIPYGGLGNWGWRSAYVPPAVNPSLAVFNALNQSFFMAGFFWMAGYFTHVRLRRTISAESDQAPAKGGSASAAITKSNDPTATLLSFTLDRAKRLLLPSVAYTLTAAPLMELMISFHRNNWTMLSHAQALQVLKTYFTTLRGFRGPVWFPTLLFIFDTLACSASTISLSLVSISNNANNPSDTKLKLEQRTNTTLLSRPRLYAVSALAVSAFASFLIRTQVPIGAIYKPLNLQPAFLPQYIFAYLAGHLAASTGGDLYVHSLLPSDQLRKRPLSSLAMSVVGMLLALAGVVALPMLGSALFGGGTSRASIQASLTNLMATANKQMLGGWNWHAALYALWNELGFVIILPAVVGVCERYFNKDHSSSFSGSWSCLLPAWLRRRLGLAETKDGVQQAKRRSNTSASNSDRNSNANAESKDLSRYAYATFLLHPLVSLSIELCIEHFLLPRCFGVAAASVPSSRGLAASARSRGTATPTAAASSSTSWFSSASKTGGSKFGSSSSISSTATTVSSSLAWNTAGWWPTPTILTLLVGTVNVLASWGAAVGLLECVPVLKRWLL